MKQGETVMTELSDNIAKSLAEIPHPSLPKGTNIYGSTKLFPDYQASEGQSWFALVHGIAHESSVSFVAILQATRALRKGFESALYFYGPGAINCIANRGFPPPATPPSPARPTSTAPWRPSSPKAAPSTAAASAWPCTERARRT
jgi:hypothetical protein